ncbi:PREDICTED: longitudinals lacking protein, isoform G-like [Ceratosolen solmsi marchali]|uniref:Longitudinals lacking protein, isoform G-like n=1 Tax=Ceratosolen solmsi marchali TaxID=326594 RepID=A0AAJ6YWX8_9HYME|nr:PREDICTED: longitudinals lacking protein, isoform G-like [Ceratosolen solmsi marchali]
MGALLSLLRSDYKHQISKHRSRPATRSTTEHRGGFNSSMLRDRRSLDTGSNSSGGGGGVGNNNHNNGNSLEGERSAREVVFPDSFEVLPQPRSDLSVVYMGVSHEQQRKFRCRFCGKGYRWKSTMRRHEMVECGGKPPAFQCPQCPYKARQRGNLTVHFKRHHQKMEMFDDSA